jgi:hypothetical protein
VCPWPQVGRRRRRPWALAASSRSSWSLSAPPNLHFLASLAATACRRLGRGRNTDGLEAVLTPAALPPARAAGPAGGAVRP